MPTSDLHMTTEICEAFCVFVDTRGFTKFCAAASNPEVRDTFQGIHTAVREEFIDKFLEFRRRWKGAVGKVEPFAKPLGDGFMFVYPVDLPERIPQDKGKRGTPFSTVCRDIGGFILGAYQGAADRIRNLPRNGSDPLCLGAGVTHGACLRVTSSEPSVLREDYVGDIVNLAARLQHCARPEGLIFDDRGPGVPRELFKGSPRKWKARTLNVPGYHPVGVFASASVHADELQYQPRLYVAPMLTATRDVLLRGYSTQGSGISGEPLLRYKPLGRDEQVVPAALIAPQPQARRLELAQVFCECATTQNPHLYPRPDSEVGRIWREAVYYRRKQSPADYDGDVLRLESYRWDGPKEAPRLCLAVRPSAYFWAYGTNFAMDFRSPSTDETIRDRLEGSTGAGPWGLGKLEGSPLGNHLGISLLLVSQDLRLVLPRRSGFVAFERGKLSPSASGTVGRQDFKWDLGNDGVKDALVKGILRETEFESGVHLEARQLRFLGGARELLRGGLPDFYFLGVSELNSDAIVDQFGGERPRESREHDSSTVSIDLAEFCKLEQKELLPIEGRESDLATMLDSWILDHRSEASAVLEVALALLGVRLGVFELQTGSSSSL
ncbi:MAG: hypothetical protein HYZ53_16840 [Planctomycetes bacterium]|nr:hypothetical protein [Planctomycetota bacterium]